MSDMAEKLNWEVKNGEAVITGLSGTAEKLFLPDEIQGIPVTEIGTGAFREHREILEARLPAGCRRLRRYVFYNCRTMKQIGIADHSTEVEDGAFKNCESLEKVLIYHESRNKTNVERTANFTGLRGILAECRQALTLSFLNGGAEQSRLYIPYYQYVHEENTAARIINQLTYGAGVSYRECIGRDGIDYRQYDELFQTAQYQMDENEAVETALFRLLFPIELRAEDEDRYRTYLKERQKVLVQQAAAGQDIERIREYIAAGIIAAEHEYDQASNEACAAGYAAGVAYLLSERKKKFGGEEEYLL